MMNENHLYERGWKGERVVYLMNKVLGKHNILWLNQHYEYAISIDFWDQEKDVFIEVKTTTYVTRNGAMKDAPFYLSKIEYALMMEKKSKYLLHYVSFGAHHIYCIENVHTKMQRLLRNLRNVTFNRNMRIFPVFRDFYDHKTLIIDNEKWRLFKNVDIKIG